MSTQNASQDTPAHPTKDDPACPERDGREAAHDDGSSDNSKETPENAPPDHGLPTHGVGRFLWEVPKDTPIHELGDAYDRWRATGDAEQTDATGWSQ